MPSIWRLTLIGESVLPEREHLHAVVCGWLDQVHDEKEKPWSIGRIELVDSGLSLEVGLLFDLEASRLLAVRRSTVRLGKRNYEVGDSVDLRSMASWLDLYEMAEPKPVIQFCFSSPLFVRGSEFTPVLFFGHLRRRFTSFAGDPELEPDIAFGHLGLSFTENELVSESVSVKLDSGKLSRATGYTGCISVEAPGASVRERRVLHALALLAPFTGLGAYTTMGFGCVSVR